MDLSNGKLEEYRSIGDELADKTILKAFEQNRKAELNQLMVQLQKNEDINQIPKDSVFKEYFEESRKLPFEIDPARIKQSETFYSEFGPEISMFLLMKSLPETYSCKKGVQVLYRTQRLLKNRDGSLDNFTRRLMETSQFVVNTLEPNAFSPEGRGFITAQKVRLMHGAIRYYVQNEVHPEFEPWDNKTLGLPINQEDLAGTLCSFSSLIIEGFDGLNIKVNPDFVDGFMQTWEIIGHAMGVPNELIAKSHKEGLEIGRAILKHQEASSEEGKLLTQACLDFIHHLLPGNQFNAVVNHLIADFIGTDRAALLGIDQSETHFQKLEEKLILFGIKSIDEFKNSHSSKLSLLKIFNRALLKGMISYYNDNKQVMYRIPPDLQNNWELEPAWERIISTPTIFNRRLTLEKKA